MLHGQSIDERYAVSVMRNEERCIILGDCYKLQDIEVAMLDITWA